MGKIKPKSLPQKELYKLLDEFYSIITLLETKDEVKNFFKDLLSISEALMIARRIQIAKMLVAGMNYDNIHSEIGAGFATIASVQRWLDAGFGGYMKALENLGKKLAEKESAYAKSYNDPLGEVKRRYPTYFAISSSFDQLSRWLAKRETKRKKKNF